MAPTSVRSPELDTLPGVGMVTSLPTSSQNASVDVKALGLNDDVLTDVNVNVSKRNGNRGRQLTWRLDCWQPRSD